MTPIELLKSGLDNKRKAPVNIKKAKGQLEWEISEYESAISSLQSIQKLNDYNAKLTLLNVLTLAYPKNKLPKKALELRYRFPVTERVETIKRIIKRMDTFLMDKKIKFYNKVQLETTCYRMRTELNWLKDALGL